MSVENYFCPYLPRCLRALDNAAVIGDFRRNPIRQLNGSMDCFYSTDCDVPRIAQDANMLEVLDALGKLDDYVISCPNQKAMEEQGMVDIREELNVLTAKVKEKLPAPRCPYRDPHY